jgi:hypothetical protein
VRRHDAFLVLTLTIVFAWTGLGTSLAADPNCMSKPNVQSPQGKHWYYFTDQVSHRKCWFTGRQRSKVGESPARREEPRASPRAAVATAPRQIRSASQPKSERLITRNAHATRADTRKILRRPEAVLNEKDRDELFAESLRWQERQNQSGAPTLRPTLQR